MKVFIFEGSLNPPTFIQTLVEQLASQGVKCYLVGFGESRQAKSLRKFTNIVSLGNNRNHLASLQAMLFLSLSVFFQNPVVFFTSLRFLLTTSNGSVRKRINHFNLRNAIHVFKPDLIHVQWATHVQDLEYLLSRAKRPKIVVSLRGKLVNVTPNINTQVFELYKRIFPQIDGFHAVSQCIKEKVENYGVAAEKIRVVYSGVKQNDIPQKNSYYISRTKTIQIISIGRFHWIKGYHHALDALCLLQKKGIPFHYTIIAGGANEEILFQVNDLELEQHVTIIPGLLHAEVFKKLAESDIFLLPSIEEGIPNVMLEAMAVGVPVICSDSGGIKEVIQHGYNGYLFRNRDVQDLANQIEQFLRYPPEQIQKIVNNARATLASQHSLEQLGESMIDLYKRVLEGK